MGASRRRRRWRIPARLLLAPIFLGLVVWLVPIRDQLTWPSRFQDRLTGTMERQMGRVVFRTSDGTVIALEEAGGQADPAYQRVSIRLPGGEWRTSALSPPERKELEGQPVPGLLSVLSALSPGPFLGAVLLYILSCLLANQRWWMLLRVVEVETSPWRVQRLGFLGLFFNNFTPGLSGGDVARAVYAARDHPGQRPQAVLAVVIDRVIGVGGLALMACVALLAAPRRFDEVGIGVVSVLALVAVGPGVLFLPRLPQLVRLDGTAARLPGVRVLRTLQSALTLYGSAPRQVARAVLLTLVVHGLSLTGVAVVGLALGLQVDSWWDYYGLAPLALVLQALPLSPVGVGEVSFVFFFGRVGLARQEALALALSYRAVQMLVSLAAGSFLLVGGKGPGIGVTRQGGQGGRRP